MKVLFRSSNLIGDALNISPALQAWYKENPNAAIGLITMDDSTKVLYRGMGVPMDVMVDEPVVEFDMEFKFDVGEAFQLGHEHQIHIAEAYGMMLGVQVETLQPTYIPYEYPHESELIIISPFSKSCSVHTTGLPNKSIPWVKLAPLVDYLKTLGPIGVIGGLDDRCPLPIREDEYYTGLPLNTVALMLRDSKLVVTIDNGMAHLAASQSAKEIVLYPSCLSPTWIAPVGNPNVRILQMDPAKVASGLLLRNVKQLAHDLLKTS